VHVTALPADYYHFDPVHHRLSGERSGRSFRLGDSVEVKVMRVDLDERKIDFELSQDKAGKGDDARRGGKPSGMGNTDVQKSRDVKKALLAGAKAGKGASGKGAAGKSASKPAGGARKGSGRGDSAPPAAGKPRKRKAKS
jgi:ribonuclease R